MWEFLHYVLSGMKLLQGRLPHIIAVSIKQNLLTGLCYGKSQTNYLKVTFELVCVE